jgi:DNA primase
MYDVTAIRQSNPIEDVTARFGVELRTAGERLVGRCPFHRDDRPSLVIYPANESYFCFGCGAGGDVIDFVARLHGVGFKEAAAMLAGPAQVDGLSKVVRLPNPDRRAALSRAEGEVIDDAALFYRDALGRRDDALGYLAARGVSPATAQRYRLGVGQPGLAEYLHRRRLSLDAAHSVGLLSGERDTMQGRIVIPDVRGDWAIWLTGRSIDGREPRYLNLRVATPLLGLDLVRSDQAVVVEGPFDWLTAVQWGLPAVALLGTRVSHSTIRALGRFRQLYLALDSDEAGQRAAAQLSARFRGGSLIVDLPQGIHDLNDLGRLVGGREAFLSCLQEANDGKERRWDSLYTASAGRAA